MPTSAAPRLQSPRQLANDRILNVEMIDLIRFFFFPHGHGRTRGLRTSSHRFVRLPGVPGRGPGCEPVLQEIKQAAESRIREFTLRRRRR